uniref:tRNA N(3)-methylcytidine methyltransferase n=1 Tax=Hyaloperonospora arabidopsidis (strain Emoy2) TaxID=559515 RepID=M4B584_HYAAE
MAKPLPHAVQLHSHDFEWNDLAKRCQMQNEESEDNVMKIDEEQELVDTQQLAKEARDKWETFHQRHNGKVYKPRNYLVREFPELCVLEREVVEVLELGCGYGSAIFPILAECPNVRAQVCDFSSHAINMLEHHPEYDATRCRAFVCDIAQEELVDVAHTSIDIVLMVFVLSALPPESFARTLQKIYAVLRPGGIVCFRDYGLYDLAMRRNAKKLGPNLYYRSDGTFAFFFSREMLVQLFEQAGFRTLEATYCTVRLRNRKKGVTMDRVWLHAKLQKPGVEESSSKA